MATLEGKKEPSEQIRVHEGGPGMGASLCLTCCQKSSLDPQTTAPTCTHRPLLPPAPTDHSPHPGEGPGLGTAP